jgi:hypothetical protein
LDAALQADGENEVLGDGLKHQKEKRSMDHFAGLDVSVKETSICIVDDTGRIVREVKVASEPEALLKVLGNPAYRFKRIGLEAGPLLSGRLKLVTTPNLIGSDPATKTIGIVDVAAFAANAEGIPPVAAITAT